SLKHQTNNKIKIILTDKYPNVHAFELLSSKTNGAISYSQTSVDAANVPGSLKGFRTMFSAFHHFGRQLGKSVIQNAVDSKSGIGIFDGGDKNIFIVLGMIIVHPIILFFFTPFFKPFRL